MTANFLHRFWRNRKGTNVVEFALVAGPLMLLLFGAIEFGRAYWDGQALLDTAIEGARCMAIPQTNCSVSGTYNANSTVAFIKAGASDRGMALTTNNIVLNRSATCSGLSGFSQVQISYVFQTAMPAPLAALAGGKTLQASACFPNQ